MNLYFNKSDRSNEELCSHSKSLSKFSNERISIRKKVNTKCETKRLKQLEKIFNKKFNDG